MNKLKFFVFIVFIAMSLSFMLPEQTPAPEILSVYLEKPFDVIKKTDDVKIKGDIDGLVAGNSYVIRIQVFEDGGTAYSAPFLLSFSVE